jgi:EF-hand domain-containing protein 1
MFGEVRQFIIQYYLVDDTVEVREVHKANDGRDPFPILIRRQKVPKDRYNVKSTFSAISMELTPEEIKDYFKPHDFGLGQTVNIYGRNFTIYDMDNFTKAFYYQNMGHTDFTPLRNENVEASGSRQVDPYPKMEIPPYNGYGSLEDSLQNCLHLVPEPPKKDYIKLMQNEHKTLRYEAVLDTARSDDKGRKFIISYRLGDDSIGVYEPPQKNTGIIGGKFLEKSRIAKPGTIFCC